MARGQTGLAWLAEGDNIRPLDASRRAVRLDPLRRIRRIVGLPKNVEIVENIEYAKSCKTLAFSKWDRFEKASFIGCHSNIKL